MSPNSRNRSPRKRRLAAAAVGTTALMAAATLPPTTTANAAQSGAAGPRMYRVTIVNLTDGQPFTPVLLATHNRRADVFEVRDKASKGVQEVAENGNLMPLVDALKGSRAVSRVVTGGTPVVPENRVDETSFPNATTQVIKAGRGAWRLSWISMLICTNDGFTGLDSMGLPRRVGDSKTRMTNAYDAGTERNTEAFKDIVPPCQPLIGVSGDAGTGMSNPDLATDQRIHHHRGIKGKADLMPDVHGWTDPVAQITVTRVR